MLKVPAWSCARSRFGSTVSKLWPIINQSKNLFLRKMLLHRITCSLYCIWGYFWGYKDHHNSTNCYVPCQLTIFYTKIVSQQATPIKPSQNRRRSSSVNRVSSLIQLLEYNGTAFQEKFACKELQLVLGIALRKFYNAEKCDLSVYASLSNKN